MGAPAVITVTDPTGQTRRFYGHWASPQYQIPHLAEFIHQADADGAPLTLAAYEAYVAGHPNTLPGEAITNQRWYRNPKKSDGLDYRYTLHLADTDDGLRYTVAKRDLHDWERMCPVEDLAGRAQLYAAAARMCREMAATTRLLVKRNGGNPVPGPSADEWQTEAGRYDAWVADHTGPVQAGTDHPAGGEASTEPAAPSGMP
jgi:hypothetical protein